MLIKLTKAWKNHQAGEELDVTDSIYEQLVKLGVVEVPEKLTASKRRTKEVSRPVRDKMISSPARSKSMAGEGETKED